MKEYKKPDLHTNSSKNYIVLSKGNANDFKTLQATPDLSTEK